MPDENGCLTPNEIEQSYEVRDYMLREYDNWVRRFGTLIATNGLRKALQEIDRQQHQERMGRHYWE